MIGSLGRLSKAGGTMQVLDEQKRLKIISAAARLFADRPFHKVLLSDVAGKARVGKGTLYTYFRNKENLYMSVLYSGFAYLVENIRLRLDRNQLAPMENLEAAIREIVQFACQNPHLFELMRTVPWRDMLDDARWREKRSELKALIVSIIRGGITANEFSDPHPELTARFIFGLVRSVLIETPQRTDPETLIEHIMWFLRSALKNPNSTNRK